MCRQRSRRLINNEGSYQSQLAVTVERKITMAENPTIEELKAPLLAAVGAADLALATVNEIVASLRERAEDARTDAGTRVGEARTNLTKLREEIPSQVGELREKLNADELR